MSLNTYLSTEWPLHSDGIPVTASLRKDDQCGWDGRVRHVGGLLHLHDKQEHILSTDISMRPQEQRNNNRGEAERYLLSGRWHVINNNFWTFFPSPKIHLRWFPGKKSYFFADLLSYKKTGEINSMRVHIYTQNFWILHRCIDLRRFVHLIWSIYREEIVLFGDLWSYENLEIRIFWGFVP